MYDFNGTAIQYIRLEIRNNHPRQLYGALFYMSSKYGMMPVFNDTLPAKKTKIAFDKAPKSGNPLRRETWLVLAGEFCGEFCRSYHAFHLARPCKESGPPLGGPATLARNLTGLCET